jgi:hypothetical protein
VNLLFQQLPKRRVDAPIFVVGCCNSGTTILWKTLRNHPDLAGPTTEGQDLADLPPILRHFLGRQTFRMFAHPRYAGSYCATEGDLTRSIADRIDAIYREHSVAGRRFLEKSPANSLRTRFLQALYPEACFVIIRRNPFAVAEGIVRKRNFDPERPHMAGMKTSLTESAQQWFHANLQLLRDMPFLRRTILIRYEDLVVDPGSTLQRVATACNLNPEVLKVPAFETDRNARQIANLSEEQHKEISLVIWGEAKRYLSYGL